MSKSKEVHTSHAKMLADHDWLMKQFKADLMGLRSTFEHYRPLLERMKRDERKEECSQ